MNAGIANDAACSVPELKETDGCVTTIVEVSHARSNRPASRTMIEIMLFVEVGVSQKCLPRFRTGAVDPVDSIDARRVQLDVRQVLARVPGKGCVSVQMHNPVLELEVSQANVDRQTLGELLAAALKVGTERRSHAIPRADRNRLCIILLSDDDHVVEEWLIDPDGLLQKVVIVEADTHRFDTHVFSLFGERELKISREVHVGLRKCRVELRG